MKVLNKVSSSRGAGPAPVRRATLSVEMIPTVSAPWVAIVPKPEECNIANISSYLVRLLQLANAYAEEEYVHTMLFQSMLHLLPGCPLLRAPRGISLSHTSNTKHVQGSTCEKCRAAIIYMRIFSLQQEGAIFSLIHRWLQTGMLSKGAPKHPQCANVHVDLRIA